MAKNAIAKRDNKYEMTTESRQEITTQAPAAQPRSRVTFTPRCDVFEDQNELALYLDLPGVSADDVDVRYENGELAIHAKCPPRHEGARCLAYEYGVGDFYRTFSVGDGVDGDRIAAELKQGVLTVRLPKHEAVKPKRITVKS